MKKIIVLLVVIVLALVAVFYIFRSEPANANLDDFAKCLASKNITMYGSYSCGSCQNEKKAFGSSFRFVPYIECTQDPNKCLAAGIEAVPTWVFPGGKKLVGEQGIEKLSKESGCLY